jgi:hypothetical protein
LNFRTEAFRSSFSYQSGQGLRRKVPLRVWRSRTEQAALETGLTDNEGSKLITQKVEK